MTTEQSSSETWEMISSRLNPHLFSGNRLSGEAYQGSTSINSNALLNRNRFDIPAKHVYARFRENGVNSTWGLQVYDAHIRAFNNYFEGDLSGKNSFEEFLEAYDSLLDSIRISGFDKRKSIIPVASDYTAIDGAHRVAACLYFREKLDIAKFAIPGDMYDYEFFTRRGMSQDVLDYVALEYCRIRPDSYAALVFPSAVGCDEQLESILCDCGEVYYKKTIELTKNGPLNLIRQVYRAEQWVGNWSDSFLGAQEKANACFPTSGSIRLYLFTSASLDEVVAAKHRIRKLYSVCNHSVHTSDCHDDTLQIAYLLLNNNSIHFLNESTPVGFPKFTAYFDIYREWLDRENLEQDYFCVDGSSAMSSYGIRDAADLDFIHHGYEGIITGIPGVSSHNEECRYHSASLDEIIFNPRHHFYYYGVKFISLHALRQMKVNRGEPKDREDKKLIDGFLNPSVYSRIQRLIRRHVHF